MDQRHLVVSCSLNENSRSRVLAQLAYEMLSGRSVAEWVDLRDYSLPVCDGAAAYEHPSVPTLRRKIGSAGSILMGIPVYNFAAASSAKNLIELTGDAWENKVVGFLCAAGGQLSYMSVLGLANSLMLDFRCVIIPRFVYADRSVFNETDLLDEGVRKRIGDLTDTAVRFADALCDTREPG